MVLKDQDICAVSYFFQASPPFVSRSGPSSRLSSIQTSERSSADDRAAAASSYRQAPCLAESYSGTSTMSDASFIHMDEPCDPYGLSRCPSRENYQPEPAPGRAVTCDPPSSLYQSMSHDHPVTWQQQGQSQAVSLGGQEGFSRLAGQMQAQMQGGHVQMMQDMDLEGNWVSEMHRRLAAK